MLSRPGHETDTAARDNTSISSHTENANRAATALELCGTPESRTARTASSEATEPTAAADPAEPAERATSRPLHHRLRRRAIELATHEARRLLIPLAVLTAISSLGTVAAPGLATSRPLLLVALSPRLSFLAIAAPKTGLAPFLLVAGIRLCLADPFHFVLGRRHGSHAIAKFADRNRILRAAHRIANTSVPLLVFLRPNGTNLAIAGASKGRAMHIAAADVVGTIVYLLLIHQLGASVIPH